MDRSLRDQFDDSVLMSGARAWGVSAADCTILAGFENFVYAFTRNGGHYVIRFVHSQRRAREDIEAELEWVRFLEHEGASVCRMIPSEEGPFILPIEVPGGFWFTTVMEKAPGEELKFGDLDDEVTREWGRVMGLTHHLTKQYEPVHDRIHWDEEEFIMTLGTNVPEFQQQADELMARLRLLPRDRDYGIVHTDFHHMNFHLHNGRITLFDFDDCAHKWFMSDIAVTFYYAALLTRRWGDPTFTAEFMDTFMEGYREHNDLDASWFDYFEDFLLLRDLVLAEVFVRSFGREDLKPSHKVRFERVMERAANKKPIVPVQGYRPE